MLMGIIPRLSQRVMRSCAQVKPWSDLVTMDAADENLDLDDDGLSATIYHY